MTIQSRFKAFSGKSYMPEQGNIIVVVNTDTFRGKERDHAPEIPPEHQVAGWQHPLAPPCDELGQDLFRMEIRTHRGRCPE